MNFTSTSNLILFPTTSTQISRHENIEQYHELARLAAWQLPPAQQHHYPRPLSPQQYQHDRQQLPQPQLPSARVAAMSISAQTEAQARRRQEREQMRRKQITSFRSEDGLLTPPPLPNFVRRKKKSIGSLRQAMESSPELGTPDTSDSESNSSSPGTPSPYGSRAYAPSAANLRIVTNHNIDAVGLGISSPKSAPLARGSPRRPSPFRNNTLDDAMLGVGLIQPPSPSIREYFTFCHHHTPPCRQVTHTPIVRPKSFWKNHPRSALTSLAYSPCSQVVRRSTFVAAGMNIDQGYWDGNYLDENDPQSPERSIPVSCKDADGDKENFDPNYESETEEARQHRAVRAFGQSLWNASTLALAAESRARGVNGPIAVACVPGEF